MNNKIYKILEKVLKKEKKYFDEEQKVILRNAVSEDAENFDEKLLEMLIGEKKLKETFFKEVGKVIIFDKDKFLTFINNKNFLPDSYTKFSQNIGLMKDGKFLKSSGKVVLNWPYKDCVLEGGQTKEDQKRNEIFFNEILEKDEIDVLLRPKVFTNFKKYGLKNEKASEIKFDGFNRDTEINKKRGLPEDTITDNLLIKGNNLLALHSLKEEFAGKVKLIYIDPPYNTGNDGFKYNDNFNHSTWLTFMKNRLKVARELLSDDGVIFVQCDDSEQAYLKVLVDDIFGYSNFVNTLVIEMSPSGGTKRAHKEKRFIKNKEYILLYKKANIKIKTINDEVEKLDGDYNIYFDGNRLDTLRNIISEKFPKYKKIPVNKYTYFEDIYSFILKNEDKIFRRHDPSSWALDLISETNLIFKKDDSFNSRTRIYKILNPKKNSDYIEEFLINIKKQNGADGFEKLEPISLKIEKNKITTLRGDLWLNFDKDMGNVQKEGSVKLSGGKKPERLIKDILISSTNKNDIVLDFFGGSGTTGAVAHKMNRQYILIEQMDYINDLPEARLKKVIEGEQGGISKVVNWKGGGEFVYMEMREFNQNFLNQIKKIKDKKELEKIFKIMKDQAFLSYRFDEKEFKEKISEFDKLELNEQKKVLNEILDKNQLYLNLSEMRDGKFGVDKKEIEINKSFYEK